MNDGSEAKGESLMILKRFKQYAGQDFTVKYNGGKYFYSAAAT